MLTQKDRSPEAVARAFLGCTAACGATEDHRAHGHRFVATRDLAKLLRARDAEWRRVVRKEVAREKHRGWRVAQVDLADRILAAAPGATRTVA